MKHKPWIDNLLSKIGKDKENFDLEEEIKSIIDAGKEKNLIDQQSGKMIQSVLELREKIVREVVVPRTEIVAVSRAQGENSSRSSSPTDGDCCCKQ